MKNTKLLLVLSLSTLVVAKQPPFMINKYRKRAIARLERLSLNEKIGQLFMAAAVPSEPKNKDLMAKKPYRMDKEYILELIHDYKIGGIIFLGTGSASQQIARTRTFQQASEIPLLIGQDLEPGLVMNVRLPEIQWPNAMTLGAIKENNLVMQVGKSIGEQCKKLGVHLEFAPVLDINNNKKNPVINVRSFGENKHQVLQKASNFIRGLQSTGVLACAKHFPGHGDTSVDSHLDLPIIKHDKKRLYAIELFPYKKIIPEGVGCIMSAHLVVPALEPTKNLPSSLSKLIMTRLLRKEFGFKGLVVTDGLDMQGVRKQFNPGVIELLALLAGNDMLICPNDIPLTVKLIKAALEDGLLSYKELDEHVLRILTVKEYIFDLQTKTPEAKNAQKLQTAENSTLRRKLYRAAITIAKNNKQILPLKKISEPLYLIEIGAEKKDMLKRVLSYYIPKKMLHSKIIHTPQEQEELQEALAAHDTIIISIQTMTRSYEDNFGINDATIDLVNRLHEQGKKVIVTLFGSPYAARIFRNADAIIVAYENNKDTQRAAAEVIVGQLQAQGKLPVSIN